MNFYNKLIGNISGAIRNSLNEMAKNISNRTIDRKLWLSVASVCSRNKATEAEFIKPMKKLTKEDLLDRYVVGLIIMKKPCPKTIKDIEKLKTLKLLGQRAIELGATILDIQDLYNINTGKTTAVTPVKPRPVLNRVSTPVVPDKKPRAPRGKIPAKFMKKIDAMLLNISPSIYNKALNLDVRSDYNITHSPIYLNSKLDIQNYIKTAIKKSHNNVELFVNYIQTDFSYFVKLLPAIPTEYMNIHFSIGDRSGGWTSYSRTVYFIIKPDAYDLHTEFMENCGNRPRNWTEKYNDENMLTGDITKYTSPLTNRHYDDRCNNLLELMAKSIFSIIVVPIIRERAENNRKANVNNCENTLSKYNMNNVTVYFRWLKNNIKNILKSNPDERICFKYSDWSGSIDGFYYNSKNNKYIMLTYYQSGSSDFSSDDDLSSLLCISDNGSYRDRWIDKDDIDEYEDPDDAIYICEVDDLEAMSKTVYEKVKYLILKGEII